MLQGGTIVWQVISRASGLVIVFTVLVLVVTGHSRDDIVTIQTLLGLAGALLGLGALLKRNGK